MVPEDSSPRVRFVEVEARVVAFGTLEVSAPGCAFAVEKHRDGSEPCWVVVQAQELGDLII